MGRFTAGLPFLSKLECTSVLCTLDVQTLEIRDHSGERDTYLVLSQTGHNFRGTVLEISFS